MDAHASYQLAWIGWHVCFVCGCELKAHTAVKTKHDVFNHRSLAVTVARVSFLMICFGQTGVRLTGAIKCTCFDGNIHH